MMAQQPAAHETSFFGLDPRHALRAAGIATAGGIGLFIASPKAVAVLFVMALVIPAVSYFHVNGRMQPLRFSPGLLALLALAAFMAVTATWAADRTAAWLAVARFVLYAVVLTSTLDLLQAADGRLINRMTHALLFAVAAMSVVVLIEAVTGMGFRRLLMSIIPLFKVADSELVAENGWVVSIQPYLINRNIAALCFMFWPAMLASRYLATTRSEIVLRYGLVATVVVAVAIAHHGSSKAALAASIAAFAIARINGLWGWRLVAGAWIAAVILVLPVALASAHLGLHHGTGLVYSAQHRVVLWGVTAAKVLERPMLGIGIGSTRVYDETDKPDVKREAKGGLPLATNVHAHNIYLQVWYELGAVGAMLLMLSGLPLLLWIRRTGPGIQPYLIAAFALGATMASFSYSFTAPWFLASFGFSTVFARLAFEAAEADARAAGEPPADTT